MRRLFPEFFKWLLLLVSLVVIVLHERRRYTRNTDRQLQYLSATRNAKSLERILMKEGLIKANPSKESFKGVSESTQILQTPDVSQDDAQVKTEAMKNDIDLSEAKSYKETATKLSEQKLDKKLILTDADFNNTVRNYADKNNVILLSVLDESYFDLAVNLLISSYRPLNITNFLIICETVDAQLKMVAYGVPCLIHEVVRDLHKASKFGTRAFIEKTLVKPLYVLKALELGFKVLLVDVDIVFFDDPLKHIDCTEGEYDLCIQSDSKHENSINSGFYFAYPTEASIKIHKDLVDTIKNGLNVRVQELMREFMIERKSKGQLTFKQLPTKVFPPGKVYFEYGARMFKGDKNCGYCVIVHNNWILHKPGKVYRMKETGLWQVDKDGYYSDSSRKYLTYSNILDIGNLTVSLEKNALKVAIIIAKLLNRTLILPTFSCYNCTNNACTRTGHKRCSLSTQFYVPHFDSVMGENYRESVFLDHDLVPESTKSSISPVIYIDSIDTFKQKSKKFGFDMPSKSTIQSGKIERLFTPSNKTKGTSSEEIENWFKMAEYDSYKVLKFHSLYFALTHISESHKDDLSIKAINKGLTGGDYRQNKIKDKFIEMGPD